MKTSLYVIPIIVGILLVLCCCLLVILGGTFFGIYEFSKLFPTIVAYTPNSPGEPTITPFEITRQPPDQIPTETLKLLNQIIVPDNNLAEMACNFSGLCNVPATLAPPSAPFTVGAHQTFWVNSEDETRYVESHQGRWGCLSDDIHSVQ